jgi:hypothetical protein
MFNEDLDFLKNKAEELKRMANIDLDDLSYEEIMSEFGLDLKQLEAQVADKYGGFKGHRICHHSDDACCRGFWNKHKDSFALGQIAQRLSVVEFVNTDTLKG